MKKARGSNRNRRPKDGRTMIAKTLLISVLLHALCFSASCGEYFTVNLPPPAYPTELLPDSPFGINTAISDHEENQDNRLKLMQEAGIKWGRQDLTWRRIETKPGVYEWGNYDRVVEQLLAHGIMILGNLAYEPDWVRDKINSPEAAEAYVKFVRAVVSRYRDKIKHWQIWNEPNFGGHFWRGTPEQYANFLNAAGKAIHDLDPKAKVAGFNAAFVDLKWTEKILSLVPYDCFDILCFHPYRPPNSPEEKEDLWFRDYDSRGRPQYSTSQLPFREVSTARVILVQPEIPARDLKHGCAEGDRVGVALGMPTDAVRVSFVAGKRTDDVRDLDLRRIFPTSGLLRQNLVSGQRRFAGKLRQLLPRNLHSALLQSARTVDYLSKPAL